MVDMSVKQGSPAGSCVKTILQGLPQGALNCELFSSEWDGAASAPDVHWHGIKAPSKPVAWRYIVFHTRVKRSVAQWLSQRDRSRVLVQATQGQWVGADIVYAHFCHGAYLADLLKQPAWLSPRYVARVITHAFNAWRERLAFEHAKVVVAPSAGLDRELRQHYSLPASKIQVLANPVDVTRFKRPECESRQSLQQRLGLESGRRWLSFMALGDFERKGLGVLLRAWAELDPESREALGLIVIGGQPDEIASFQRLAAEMGLAARVRFVGMQSDVRPYLWASDVFAFPSAYEIFSLAILQAAAAGLPVMVTQRLYGAEEFVEDGFNGWQVSRDVQGVRQALLKIATLMPEALWAMGQNAQQSVAQYSQEAFVQKWRSLYRSLGLE